MKMKIVRNAVPTRGRPEKYPFGQLAIGDALQFKSKDPDELKKIYKRMRSAYSYADRHNVVFSLSKQDNIVQVLRVA